MRDLSSSAGRLRYNHAYSFRADDGRFLLAAGGGGGQLLANGTVGARPVALTVRNPAGLYAQGDLRYGSPVGLETPDGHYVCAEGGGGREVVADRSALLAWERFTLDLLMVGHFRTMTGHAMRAESGPGRPVTARSATVGPSSIFEVCLLSGWPLEDRDQIALRAQDGGIVTAEGGGGGALNAGAGGIGAFQRLTVRIVDHPSPWTWLVSLQSTNGQWVCAEGGGGGDITATRAVPREWETFEFGRIL